MAAHVAQPLHLDLHCAAASPLKASKELLSPQQQSDIVLIGQHSLQSKTRRLMIDGPVSVAASPGLHLAAGSGFNMKGLSIPSVMI